MIDFLAIVFFSLFFNMTIGVVIVLFIKNMSVVDVFWATGITLTAWSVYLLSPSSIVSLIIVLAVSLWGIRLAIFLLITRTLPKHQDRRYQRIARQWKKGSKPIRVALHFYMQATLQIAMCLCFYPIYLGLSSHISFLQLGALSIFFIAFLGQLMADLQLNAFKKQKNKEICQLKLWGLSRHPNYFFENLIWISLSVMTMPSKGFFLAILSPMSIWIITRFITGPYTERLSLEKYGKSYEDYQKKVPMIIPSLTMIITKLFKDKN